MKKFDITGMSCAACSSKVQKTVSALDGVEECAVNLLTNSMTVTGDVDDKTVIEAVKKAGYGAKVSGADRNAKSDINDNTGVGRVIVRLISSAVVLIALMYIAMGHMLGLPLPTALQENHLANAILQMLLSAVVLIINQKFFINGVRGIISLAPNMDTLVSLGSGASFIYSVCVVFKMTDHVVRGDASGAASCLHSLYFESAAMILVLITVGKLLEEIAKGKTTSAIKGLMDLAPKTTRRIDADGNEHLVDSDKIEVGDIIALYAGESVVADGKVIMGECSVDEAMLTGESLPQDKGVGDAVYGGTINKSGYVRFKVEKAHEDTTLYEIIRMVSDAAATKAPIAKIADKVAGFFVPLILGIALVCGIVWYASGAGIGVALTHAISVLVISCPCSLGLATPVAIMVGSGVGAKRGILYKTAASLEATGRVNVVILDKTGTVTRGKPEVTDIIAVSGNEDELIEIAYAIESKSEHPLACAIAEYAKEKGIICRDTEKFKTLSGSGVTCKLDGESIACGKLEFISEYALMSDEIRNIAEELSCKGKTCVFISRGASVIGMIALADALKSDSIEAVRELSDMGIYTVMLTGDNERTAKAVGDACGVDEVIANVLPSEKQAVVERYKRSGKVIMVGDGINDAPALTAADIGMAIGAGSDIAVSAADVVLMRDGLSCVPTAIKLSRATLVNIRENLFWAFFYNMIGVPLAAGVFVNINGWSISPMFGAMAMSLSSFCVVMNALRLNLAKPERHVKLKKKKKQMLFSDIKNEKEKTMMEITLKIEGMMCPHCEARVKESLEKNEKVISATVSHQNGTACVQTKDGCTYDELAEIVENAGYKVIK